MNLATTILAYGTSEGVAKAWDSRGRGRTQANVGFSKPNWNNTKAPMPDTGKQMKSAVGALKKMGYKEPYAPHSGSAGDIRSFKHPDGHTASVKENIGVSMNAPSEHVDAVRTAVRGR
jgi:hypothetical protein